MQDLAKSIGARVRELREAQGLTLDQLSQASGGVPPESISRVERGRTLASLRTLDRLAHGLGVGLVDMLDGTPVTQASAERIPPEVRGIALRLSGQAPEVLDRISRIVNILLE